MSTSSADVPSYSHKPDGLVTAFKLEVKAGITNGATRVVQTIYAQDGTVYTRTNNPNGWSAWGRMDGYGQTTLADLASALGVKWQNILTTSNPSLQLIEGAVYIIGYDANYARQGFIRVQNNVVEYVLKPYSFDTYISLTSDNSVLTATFLKSAITSMAIRQLLVTI